MSGGDADFEWDLPADSPMPSELGGAADRTSDSTTENSWSAHDDRSVGIPDPARPASGNPGGTGGFRPGGPEMTPEERIAVLRNQLPAQATPAPFVAPVAAPRPLREPGFAPPAPATPTGPSAPPAGPSFPDISSYPPDVPHFAPRDRTAPSGISGGKGGQYNQKSQQGTPRGNKLRGAFGAARKSSGGAIRGSGSAVREFTSFWFNPQHFSGHVQRAQRSAEGVMTQVDSHGRRIAAATAGAVDESGRTVAAAASVFDTTGDGRIGLDDVLPTHEIEGDEPHVEAQYMRRPAIFTVLQTMFVIGPWIVELVYRMTGEGSGSLLKTKIGFETIWPGETDLRLTTDCKDQRLEVYRWITYQYTHIGITHVLVNCLFLLVLGTPLEGFHGTVRLWCMWTVGVIGGAGTYMLWDARNSVVGMSGGCYALLGAHLATVVMNWSQMKYRFAQILFLLLLAGGDFVQSYYANPGVDTKPSVSCHFGGYVFGVITAIVVGKNMVWKNCERATWIVSIFIGVGLFAFMVSWGMIWPPRSLWDPVRYCWWRQVSDYPTFKNLDWHCIRCDDLTCASTWSNKSYVMPVDSALCDDRGWAVTQR